MQKQESFGQDLAQSQQEFKKQFDPTSPHYHNGIKVQVPTGGERIPQSMSTMYPQGYDPTQPQQVIDYGEQYRNIEANRNVFQNLKKQLAKLGPVVESFLRHQQTFKQKGDPTNEKHIKLHQQNIAKQKIVLKSVQQLLEAFIPTLQKIQNEGKQVAKQLAQIIVQSNKTYSNKESLTQFNFKMKRLSTKTFSIAQKCLQKLKDIKKQYTNSKKSAPKAQ